MVAFSLWLDLAIEVNCHFLENEHSLNRVINFSNHVKKYGSILRVELTLYMYNSNNNFCQKHEFSKQL